jgi:hypothetical protein
MRKIIIITALMLFALSVHAQRTSGKRSRHEPEKHKSETIVRRSAVQKKSSENNQATRTRQAARSRQDNQRYISHAKRNRTSSTRSRSGDHTGASRRQAFRSTYEKPGKGQIKSGDIGKQNRKKSSYKGYNLPPDKGNKSRSSTSVYKGNRNDRSVRGNNARHYQATRKQHTTGKHNVIRKHNTSVDHSARRRHYNTPNRRAVRTNHVKGYRYNPVRYRSVNYHYRVPKRIHVKWTHRMYHDYRIMYPEFSYWYYPIGYRIVTIPTYHAYYHIGEVRNVYGRVHEVYYSWTTDEYHLYFGGEYPYHDFTVIISGRHARRFARHPEWFFEGRYMWVTGLLSTFDGRPELIVKRRSQIHLY